MHHTLRISYRGSVDVRNVLNKFRNVLRACSRRRIVLAIFVVFFPMTLQAQTTTQTLQANIAPLGGLFTISSSVTFTKVGTVFNSYTGGPVNIQYRIRTTQATGSGTITMKVTSDFAPANGPSVANPPTAGDKLTYTCSGATLGTNCTGAITASTTTATSVVAIPASSCTGSSPCSPATPDPNTVNVNFTLTNDPKYKVNSYSATVTWTISAS
jgi:hypothetical protein